LYNTFSFALRKSACQKTTAAAAAEEEAYINAEQQQAGHVETTMTTSANKMTIHLVAKPLHSQKDKNGAACNNSAKTRQQFNQQPAQR
jgi:hypothetical protein